MATVVDQLPRKGTRDTSIDLLMSVGREDCVRQDLTGRRTDRDILQALIGGSARPRRSTVAALLSYLALA